MRLNRGTQAFWLQLGNMTLFWLIMAAIAYFLMGRNGALIVGIVFVAQLIGFLVSVKTQMIQALPKHWEFGPANPADLPDLDHAWLEAQTATLKSLGFIRLMDYRLTNSTLAGFARCFSHPQHYCFCEINQSFPTDQPAIANCLLASQLESDWTLVHLTQPASMINSLSYLWRHPRSVAYFRRADQPPADLNTLLQNHLQCRQQMLVDLGLSVITDVSWEAYQAHERRTMDYRRKRLKERNLLFGMLEVLLYELKPKSEWLGDYERFVRRRRSRDYQ